MNPIQQQGGADTVLQTEIIHIQAPGDEAIRRAAAIIRAGGLVVFPTETVYGLGGNGLDAEAARRIYAAKGRPSDNPLIIHVAQPEDAYAYTVTDEVSRALYEKLARAFMPGPLTVILPRADVVPLSTTGGLDTVNVLVFLSSSKRWAQTLHPWHTTHLVRLLPMMRM